MIADDELLCPIWGVLQKLIKSEPRTPEVMFVARCPVLNFYGGF
jgi:hypothetical protein